jgi:hypothetical protein
MKYLEWASLFNDWIHLERNFEFLCHSIVHDGKFTIRRNLI